MSNWRKMTLLGLSALTLAACGTPSDVEVSEEASSTSAVLQESSSAISEVSKVTEIPQEEIGTGYFNLVNASGTTEMGQPITVLYEPDTVGADFDIETTDFDGSHLTYIYVDGIFIEKKQFGTAQHQFDVPDDILKNEGTHIVSLIQYDNDEENGKAITVKHQAFEVTK